MNIEPRLCVVEWEKMKKQTYDLEERLLKESDRSIFSRNRHDNETCFTFIFSCLPFF